MFRIRGIDWIINLKHRNSYLTLIISNILVTLRSACSVLIKIEILKFFSFRIERFSNWILVISHICYWFGLQDCNFITRAWSKIDTRLVNWEFKEIKSNLHSFLKILKKTKFKLLFPSRRNREEEKFVWKKKTRGSISIKINLSKTLTRYQAWLDEMRKESRDSSISTQFLR